jgi:signal transduction histidine kinase
MDATDVERDRNQVELRLDLDDITVEADAELLLLLLVNLTLNAIQAMPSGGQVIVRAERDLLWTRLLVVDDGPGVPPEIAPRLFTPFATSRPDGHGLGLALAQNIAVAHGGRIEATSNAPRRGTTFRVWLPA